MLNFDEEATFILSGPPRPVRKTGASASGPTEERVAAYPVMVLGFGRPIHISVRVPGDPVRLAEGDTIEFTNLKGRLYRGAGDSGTTAQRISFTASGVARAKGREVPSGVEV